MKTLVTGGAGFIGSHLVERLLKDGHEVVVIDDLSTGRPQNLEGVPRSAPLTLARVSINDTDAIKPLFAGIDWVFHLAGRGEIVPSIQNPTEYFHVNVAGTVSVLEAARHAGVKRFVYAASSSCYGLAEEIPTSEVAPIRPQYPYALTKYLGEQCVFHWGLVYKMPVVSVCIFNAYGTRQRTSGTYGAVFGVFLAQKLNGKPFTIVGDGTQRRDFLYVTDVADAFVRAAASNVTGERFNLGAGDPVSVNRLVELLGAKEIVRIPKRPGEPDVTHADISKIRRVLGWKQAVTFEQGVAEMLRNIDYWRQAPVWTPDTIRDATREWFQYLSK